MLLGIKKRRDVKEGAVGRGQQLGEGRAAECCRAKGGLRPRWK